MMDMFQHMHVLKHSPSRQEKLATIKKNVGREFLKQKADRGDQPRVHVNQLIRYYCNFLCA